MKKLFVVLVVVLLFISQIATATDIELVCPCQVNSSNQTGFNATLGIRSIDVLETSGELRLKLVAGSVPSFFDAQLGLLATTSISHITF